MMAETFFLIEAVGFASLLGHDTHAHTHKTDSANESLGANLEHLRSQRVGTQKMLDMKQFRVSCLD